MASGQQRAANAKRDRGSDPVPDRELWAPPPKEECDESEIPVPLDTTHQLTMRRREWRGQLVDYAVVLSAKNADGKWVEITCIDCCHGHVHRHNGPHKGTATRTIRPIYTQEDVQQSFKSSYEEVYDSYMEIVQRSVEK